MSQKPKVVSLCASKMEMKGQNNGQFTNTHPLAGTTKKRGVTF